MLLPYLFRQISLLILKCFFFFLLFFSKQYCSVLHSSFFWLYVCERLRDMLRLVCKQNVLDQFCNVGALSFLLKCMGRSTKKRSKVRLHFNKEPSLSSLMLCCHALWLQRNGTLVTENWSKRHWAFPELTSPHHSHLHTVYGCVMCVQRSQFRRLE